MIRTGSAQWNGDLRTGKGSVSTQSGALKGAPYSFTSRFESGAGTNPEELIGAAHAACFSMALSNELAGQGIVADAIETSAAVEIRPVVGGGFAIPSVRLSVLIRAPGADRLAVDAATLSAKANCPVSKLLNAEITMEVTIEG